MNGEKMMVLYNPSKIANIYRVNPKDKFEEYDLKKYWQNK